MHQVCHSAKDAETRNLCKLVDDSVYLARQIEYIYFNSVNKTKIPVKLYTDSRTTLESIASTSQVERKLMRNIVTELKDKLRDGEIECYCWLESHEMVADTLTKEGINNKYLDELKKNGQFHFAFDAKNMVFHQNNEIKLENISIKEKNKVSLQS